MFKGMSLIRDGLVRAWYCDVSGLAYARYQPKVPTLDFVLARVVV